MEQVLREGGYHYGYAMRSGRRVSPGDAYRADPLEVSSDTTVIFIECGVEPMPELSIRVDHHRPGDPGYALGPERFFEASSLGQLHGLLKRKPLQEDLVLAAFDHCFSAALQGKCAGVSAAAILELKIAEIARSTGNSVDMVRLGIRQVEDLFRVEPRIRIGSQLVVDHSGYYCGEGYSLEYLIAATAAAVADVPVLIRHRDLTRAPEKYTLCGAADPETITAFMDEWAPAHGLERIFGVPNRGYAGGYAK